LGFNHYWNLWASYALRERTLPFLFIGQRCRMEVRHVDAIKKPGGNPTLVSSSADSVKFGTRSEPAKLERGSRPRLHEVCADGPWLSMELLDMAKGSSHFGEFDDDKTYTQHRIASIIQRDTEWVMNNIFFPKCGGKGVKHRKIGALYFVTGEWFRHWLEGAIEDGDTES